ncbi:transmembrane protein 243 isoform X2 [Psammomys obesus]|uniref:transmembrane protein 243 isoform X2 n=1 Tax=Psammomys obesus TaxID=48139 RepID=UPI002453074A|nr:transmembrane protein 243 isoform X2 [Psammomys obesus]
MEDFTTRTYGTSGLDNRPLFGETSAKDRIINLVVGSLTTLLILLVPVKKLLSPVTPQNFNIQWTFSKDDMDCKITSYANELKVAYFKKQWNYYDVN